MSRVDDGGRRKKPVWLACVALTALAAFFFFLGPPEPRFEGRKLSSWLAEGTSLTGNDNRATAALKSLNGRAVPHLLDMLRFTESPARRWVRRLIQTQPILKNALASESEIHERGVFGFTALGSSAGSARNQLYALLLRAKKPEIIARALAATGPESLPFLQNALTNSNANVRCAAARVSGSLQFGSESGTQVDSALESLMYRLEDPDATVRAAACYGIAHLPTRKNDIVPKLILMLGDSAMEVREAAAYTLGMYDGMSKPAIPFLERCASETNILVRRAAKLAIERITTNAPRAL